MHRLGIIALGAILVLCSFVFAYAEEPATATGETVAAPAADTAPAENAYGFSLDDIAVNQGVVAYWYAHGFANAFGSLPMKWADVVARKVLLRGFKSPHTGEEIDFDDGSLDFDGDMTYKLTGCDAMIEVKTSTGTVVLPGTLQGGWNCPQRNCNSCNPCNQCSNRCPTCCDITICGWDCWGCMCPDDAVCKIIQWMMWKSFETYECRYGCRPADEPMWIASGIAPIDKNWKELAPQMYIEYIYGKCEIRKAKVHCCKPCGYKCGSCGDCGHQVASCGGCNQPSCGQCQQKCNKCSSGCNKCGKPDCNKCHAKSSCSSCGKSSCKGNCERSNCDQCSSAGKGCERCGGRGCNRCDREDEGTWME